MAKHKVTVWAGRSCFDTNPSEWADKHNGISLFFTKGTKENTPPEDWPPIKMKLIVDDKK